MFRFAFLLTILIPLTAQAGGSVSLEEDIRPLLVKRPDLAERLKGLQVDPVGIGTRIGYRVCPPLSGTRIGPYRFEAKGADGRALHVVFLTHDLFRDARGEKVAEYDKGLRVFGDDIAQATAVEEDLVGVDVAP